MNNLILNWWRSRQFSTALQQGNTHLAIKILQQIQKSGAKLSLLQQQFNKQLQAQKTLQRKSQELENLKAKYSQSRQQISKLESLINFFPSEETFLATDSKFIELIENTFQIIPQDENLLQVTGIDKQIFYEFEASLVDFLKEEFYNIKPAEKLQKEIKEAQTDLERLKYGQDPQYSLKLTPHVYFMRYFLENVYCAYLAWFLIYKTGLLPQKINILDIAAGPSTIAYGLSLFLKSISSFLENPQMHISYYSLEQLNLFQYRGLQFWRRYIEPQPMATNAYFRFDTTNLFDYDPNTKKIPEKFYDFIVISHCLFYDPEQRKKANQIFKQIFAHSLKNDGYVLLIVQDKKLFNTYNTKLEYREQEPIIISQFMQEMELNLVWYKHLNSKGTQTFEKKSDFNKFARENLPPQKYMSSLARQYLDLNFDLNYILDDYVILAER